MIRGQAIPRKTFRALWTRANGRCEAGTRWCWGTGQDPHHVKSRARGGSNNLTNLLLVCRPCHDAIEQHRPGTGKFRTHSWQAEGERESHGQ